MAPPFFNNPDFDGNYLFREITFNEFIDIKSFITLNNISFEGCTFPNFTYFENIEADEIVFTNCIFEDLLSFGNSKCKGLIINNCSFGSLNIFKNYATTTSLISVTSKSIEISGTFYSLNISNTIAGMIDISETNGVSSKNSTITFGVNNEIEKLNIQAPSNLSKIKIVGGNYKFVFFDGEFTSSLLFEGEATVENLYFESSSFYKRIDFDSGKFNYVSFYRSIFQSVVHIEQANSSKSLYIKDLTFHSSNFSKNVIIGNKLERFNSSNCVYKETFRLNSHNKINDEKNLIFISFDEVNQGTMIFEKIYGIIDFSGFNEANIYFKDIDLDSFVLRNFQNVGTISISNLRSGRYFVAENTICGNINFINSDINIFEEIVFAESNVENINFNNYPTKIVSTNKNPAIGYGILDKSVHKKNLRYIYNQLKKNAKEKGNIDAANRFESLEYKQLLLSRRFGFDSILLLLNLISNNNGRSWFQGVIFTLSIAFIFCILYLHSLDILCFKSEYFEDYIIFISSFPKLEIDKYLSYQKKWDTYLIIWLSRIFISYGIYQTIAAFRKYGKS